MIGYEELLEFWENHASGDEAATEDMLGRVNAGEPYDSRIPPVVCRETTSWAAAVPGPRAARHADRALVGLGLPPGEPEDHD